MKKNQLLTFTSGFILGISLCILFAFKNSSTKREYFKLKKDYCIENIGYLKSGTTLKIDAGASEGFTRYILYLNISDSQCLDKYETEHRNTIIPYWLIEKDSTCSH